MKTRSQPTQKGDLVQLERLVKRVVKKLFPTIVSWRHARNVAANRDPFRGLSVAETFTRLYKTGWWGVESGEPFCSGHGSRNEFAKRYVETVVKFISQRGITSVVDIGCGDFKIGEQIVSHSGVNYVGIDIVPELIQHHCRVHADSGVQFLCANAIESDLPDGELCLIRQVLQHLSNAQVEAILRKCMKYRHIIVTEDVYVGPGAVPNIDKPHGPDTRWFEKSGIFVEAPPFDLDAQFLLQIPAGDNAVLRTMAIQSKIELRHN